jgi:hypothetical protein
MYKDIPLPKMPNCVVSVGGATVAIGMADGSIYFANLQCRTLTQVVVVGGRDGGEGRLQ